MTNRFKSPNEHPVEWYPTKYDSFKIVTTGLPYKSQSGSGRSKVLSLIDHDMTIGDLTKKAAEIGFTPSYAVSAFDKHHNTKDGAFRFSETNDQGLTLEQVKAQRNERPLTEEQKAKREAMAAAKADRARVREEKKAEKEAIKAAKAAERAAKKEQASAEPSADGETTSTAPADAGEGEAPQPKKARRGKKVAAEAAAEQAQA